MSNCNLFDKYRDGEMSCAERDSFESHLSGCADCRQKMALLNNIVQLARQQQPHPIDLAERIAGRAFQQGRSWDALVLSWLRPGQALAALVLAMVFFSFIWLTPIFRQVSVLSEYEELMNQADAILAGKSVLQANGTSEPVFWWQQEGDPQ